MLKELTKDILFPFYKALRLFFESIFQYEQQYGFVVFIARRCSNLLEIFFQLWTEDSPRKFPPNFITDSALLAQVPLLATYYQRWGGFPPILIVDDIVIYGRSLNTFLEDLEDALCAELEPCGCSREKITSALIQAVRIHTYARNNRPLLLNSRYQSNFSAVETMDPVGWRDLSNRISRLILLRGEVNSCFISGAELSARPEDDTALYQAGFSRVETTYDAFPQTMYCRTVYLPSGDMIIYTVRIFSSSANGAIVAAPFVFFPELAEADLDRLFDAAARLCGLRLDTEEFDSALSHNRRMKAEALTLLLSSSLLRDFCRLARVSARPTGRIKLQMNFGTGYNLSASQFVELMLDPKSELLTIDQMDHLIETILGYEYDGLSFPLPIEARGDEQLRVRLENNLYRIGTDNYAQAYWQTQTYQSEQNGEKKSYFATAPELFEQFCRSDYSVPHVASWMFQMADAGILSFITRIMRANAQGQAGRVAQCVKTGEQSQFILPKRLRDFIPILAYIQKKAYVLNRDFQDELYRFSQVNQDIQANLTPINQFLAALSDSGQELSDWNFDLTPLPDSSSPNWEEGMRSAMRSMRRQQSMMEAYDRFVQTEQS